MFSGSKSSSLLGKTAGILESSSLTGTTRLRGASKGSSLIGTTSSLYDKPGFSSSMSTDIVPLKVTTNISTLESDLARMRGGMFGDSRDSPFSGSLESDIQKMESDIHKRSGGVLVETASNFTVSTLANLENDLHKIENDTRRMIDSAPATPKLPLRSVGEEAFLKTESFEEKMDSKRDELFHAQSQALGDQISHLLHDMSDIRNEMKGMARREEGLRAEAFSAVISRQEELERQIMALASKERDTITAMEVQAKEVQKVSANSAIGQRDIEDALDRGLKAIYQSLEKGLEKEANQRIDQNRLTNQAMKAAFEEHRAERDEALKIIRQEREAAFQQHVRDRQEAMQAQQRESIEHMVQERKLRDDGQRALQEGLKSLEMQLHRDTEKQVVGLAEALKGLEQKSRAERDEILKIIRHERDAAFQQHTRDRQEALQAQHREAMEHMVQERKLRDEGQRSTQEGLRALEVKLHRDTEKQVKDQADALKALEQKLRFERDEMLKIIRQEKEAAFQQHTRDRQEALQAQHREAMEHMAQERQLRDEGQRSMQESLRALEIKLHRDTEKQVHDQGEALRALDQKLRVERDEMFKILRHEREEGLRQNTKDRQEALQAQHREAMEHMVKERQLRDEGQRTMQDGLKALEIKLHRDTEKQVKDQAEVLRALEQTLARDLQQLAADLNNKTQDVKDLAQANSRESADKLASAISYLRDDFEKTLKTTNGRVDGNKEASEHRVGQLEKKVETALAETHVALQTLLAEQGKNFANEHTALKELHTALKVEFQNRQAELDKRVSKSHDDLINDIQNVSGIHNKKHEQTKELVKSVNDDSNARYESLSQALDKVQKNQQNELAVLRSDMDGTHGSLREVLMEVTKQVDNLDQSIQREHMLILAAEEKFEKSLAQVRNDVSDSIEESNETLRLVLVEQGEKAESLKSALQKQHQALKAEIDENRGSVEQTFRDQAAKDKRLQEELASQQMQLSALLSEVHSSHTALRDSLVQSSKSIEDVEERLQRENKRHLLVEERLDKALEAMRQEIMDEHLAALKKELLGAHNSFRESVDELKSAMQDAHKVLRAEMKDNVETSERAVKEFAEETQRALQELSDLHEKVIKDMEADFQSNIRALTDAGVRRDADLRSLLESVDKSHHEKHSLNAAALEDFTTRSLTSTQKRLREDMEAMHAGIDDNHGALKECWSELSQQLEDLTNTVKKERKARLLADELQEKYYNELRKDINATQIHKITGRA